MKVFLTMVFLIILVLAGVSLFIPPLPVWEGGMIGIFVFLGVGNLLASLFE